MIQNQCTAPVTNPLVGKPAEYEPTIQDWIDYHDWCHEVELRDMDRRDARRELEYQDLLDAML